MGDWLTLASEGRLMVEAMSLMGYDAMGIGWYDLFKGLEVAQERAQEAAFPFLAANLIDPESGEPLFEPFTIVERGGLRIGIIGLTHPDTARIPQLQGQVAAADPFSTARKYVAKLRDQVDVLIVLSYMGIEMDQQLAQKVPGIQIIVGGRSRKLMRNPVRVGNTLIVQQGYDGEWMGRLEVGFDREGVPRYVEERILTLGPDYSDNRALRELITSYIARYPEPTPTAMIIMK